MCEKVSVCACVEYRYDIYVCRYVELVYIYSCLYMWLGLWARKNTVLEYFRQTIKFDLIHFALTFWPRLLLLYFHPDFKLSCFLFRMPNYRNVPLKNHTALPMIWRRKQYAKAAYTLRRILAIAVTEQLTRILEIDNACCHMLFNKLIIKLLRSQT